MGERTGVYRVLVGRPEGKRPLQKVGCGGMHWTELAKDRDR
jgi:hypothetical protein